MPRRVSGPATRSVVVPSPSRRPRTRPSLAPRRSITIPRPKFARPRIRLHFAPAELPAATLAFVRSLPDHRWLDRLVRGRAWIPVLGVLLTGIVAMQVEVLKLGASIGRSVSLATELQSRNQLLRSSVAQLSDDQRLMRQAAKLGMVMPGPTENAFVPAHSRGALGKAIAGITAPDASAFLTALAAQESADGVANATLGTTGSPVGAPTTPTQSTGAASATATPATTTTPAATSTATSTATTPSTTSTATTPAAGGTAQTPAAATTSPTTQTTSSASSTGGAAAG
jgi:hypothetical protein